MGFPARVVLNGRRYGTIKHFFEVLLCQSRTLHILMGSYPPCQPLGRGEVHGFAAALGQMNEDVHIVTKVRLSSNQNDGRGWVASTDLWDPFGSDVIKGQRVDDAEAEDEDVHVGIAQRAHVAKLLLPQIKEASLEKRTPWVPLMKP